MSPRFLTSLKVLGFAFAFVLAAELILRTTGLYFVPHESGYEDISQDQNKIRILVLGESTTDDRFAKGNSWASQMEKLLRAKGHNVRVYNEARVGSNSALLMSRLPDQLDLYRPHIVMTMMGINDTESMIYNFTDPPMKVQKLYRLVSERIKSRLSCETELVHPTQASRENITHWMKFTAPSDLATLEKEIRLKVKSEEEVASTLTLIAALMKNQHFPFDESRFMHILDRAHVIHPRNDHTIRLMLGIFTGRRNPRCVEISNEILPCGINLNDEYLKLIADCHKHMKKPLSHETFEIRGLSLMSGTGFTAKHFQKLAQILKSKNITLVAMQYPTLPLENLKQNFKDQKDIVFISNEENFREALTKHPFKEIFMDNFRATWGHTTELGHGLIAEGALIKIEPIVRNLKK